MTDFEVRDLPAQPTAVRRSRVPVAGLKDFFDDTYRRVWTAVEAQGLQVAGPPFAMYHGMPTEVVDMEAGFPVEGTFAASEDLQPSTLPGSRAVVGLHVGPYERLGDTWSAMVDWSRERGLQPHRDIFWEVYLSDPSAEPDPEQWRTQLVQPVE